MGPLAGGCANPLRGHPPLGRTGAQGEGEMTDPLRTDDRVRAILSSWYRSPRYRSKVMTQHWNRSVPSSRQTELNRELKEGPRFSEWQWFVVPLAVLAIIDFFYLRIWG